MLRATLIFLISGLLLTGCQQYETPELERETTKMGVTERSSYVAIVHYFHCMAPLVRAAKKGPPLSDTQVQHLGNRCPAELHDAVIKHDAWTLARPPRDSDDLKTLRLPPAERLRREEEFLAGAFWCDFRTCWID